MSMQNIPPNQSDLDTCRNNYDRWEHLSKVKI